MTEKKPGKARVYESPNKLGFCIVAEDVPELLTAIGAVSESSDDSFEPLSTETRYTGAKLTKTDDGFDVQFKSEILCVLTAKGDSKFQPNVPSEEVVTVSHLLHGVSDIVTKSMIMDILGVSESNDKPDKEKEKH